MRGKASGEAIDKAYRFLLVQLSWRASSQAHRRDISGNGGLRPIRIDPVSEKLTANRHCFGKLDPGIVLVAALFADDASRDELCEMIQDEPGIDFLLDKGRFPAVKVQQTHRELEFAEGGLNSPAHAIELFEFL